MRIAFLTPEQSASTLGAMPAGAVVMEVESGRPMAKSGIHVGDVVVSIGGKKIGTKTICARLFLKSVQARLTILTGAAAIPKPWRSTAPIAKLNDAGSFIDKSPMKSGKQRRLEIVARRKNSRSSARRWPRRLH